MARDSHLFKDSTRLTRGWYDSTTRTVELEFRRDHAHVLYRNVPPAVWGELIRSKSAGRYVTDTLEKFPFRRR